MKSNKYFKEKTQIDSNLIGQSHYRHYLKLQAIYGLAQRGGVQFPHISLEHSKRLVSDVNILTSNENKQVIFSESIFSN